jgi:hypothetical protein
LFRFLFLFLLLSDVFYCFPSGSAIHWYNT